MGKMIIYTENDRLAIGEIKKTLARHGLKGSANVNALLGVLVDLNEGRRGVGNERADAVSYHGLWHVSDVLNFSLNNFVAYDGGKFAGSKYYSIKEELASSILSHDFGYFMKNPEIDFGTMKIEHERKGVEFVEKLAKEGVIHFSNKRLMNMRDMIYATVVNGAIKVGNLEDTVNVATMMIRVGDVIGSSKNYLLTLPNLYAEFNRDADVLKGVLGRGDIDEVTRKSVEMELRKIPIASSPKEIAKGTKDFLDYVYNVMAKDALVHVSDMGHARENRAENEKICAGS